MITGDYPTAAAIGRKIDQPTETQIMTGAEIDRIQAGDFRCRFANTAIFVRVLLDQKLDLVEAFENNGEVSRMTGDSINDAPALKAAQIGIEIRRPRARVRDLNSSALSV